MIHIDITESYDKALQRALSFLGGLDDSHTFALYNSNEVDSPYSDTRLLLMIGDSSSKRHRSLTTVLAHGWVSCLIPFEYHHSLFGIQAPQTYTPLIFEPNLVLEFMENNSWKVHLASRPELVHRFINTIASKSESNVEVEWNQIDQQDYRNGFETIYSHICRGDIYEANYCVPFYGKYKNNKVLDLYLKINRETRAPFSAIFKMDNTLILSFSPERFYLKHQDSLISQPIKGTAKTDWDNPENNKKLIHELQNSTKERAENTMIVDLVRNDMSQLAKTVSVPKYLEVQSFPTVHQLVSTVQGRVLPNTSMRQVFRHLFPMGSMTGAPKKSMLTIVNALEHTRGYYSGSIGYQRPNGTQNFNVVIRSLVFDLQKQWVNLWVGSAITFYSNVQDEFNECLVKAQMILKLTK